MSRHLADIFRRAARGQADNALQGDSSVATQLTITDLLRLHGEDSAAVLLMLTATLSCVPMPGVGSMMSLAIFVLALRWHKGADASVLPQRLGNVTLSETWSRRVLHFLAWLYDTADRKLKTRWSPLFHRSASPWWALWIALMGFLIFLPLPLGNFLPGVSLVLLSLAWMFRDGMMLLLSTVVGSGAIGFALAVSAALVQSYNMAVEAAMRVVGG